MNEQTRLNLPEKGVQEPYCLRLRNPNFIRIFFLQTHVENTYFSHDLPETLRKSVFTSTSVRKFCIHINFARIFLRIPYLQLSVRTSILEDKNIKDIFIFISVTSQKQHFPLYSKSIWFFTIWSLSDYPVSSYRKTCVAKRREVILDIMGHTKIASVS